MQTIRYSLIFLVVTALLFGCSSPGLRFDATATAGAPETKVALTVSEATAVANVDYWPTHGWRSATPESQGMDSETLGRMFDDVQKNKIRLHSVVIVRNGYLVTEAYFNTYTRDTRPVVQSITKSVMGALIGIAVGDGSIKSADQRVLDFFPGRTIANLDERKQAMRVRDLLTLTSGLNCQDFGAAGPVMEQSADWVQFALDLPMAATPGKEWRYCSVQSHLLSAVLQQATGQDARSFANERLFRPLGIADVPPERWGADPQGVTTGGYGLALSPAELAKFALLYLNDGRWEDRQLIPAEWVRASIAQQAQAQKRDYIDVARGYGYQWSVFPEVGIVSALGLAGQHIHLMPELNLAVIFTAAIPQDGTEFDLVRNYIIPAVKSAGALPENPDAAQKLAAAMEASVNPVRPVAPLPETARAISGRVIAMQDNAMGWENIVLTFEDGSREAQIEVSEALTIPIGLDNLYRIAADNPWAARGYWESENVLVLEGGVLEQGSDYLLRFRFDGERVKVIVQDRAFMGPTIYMSGVIQ